MRDRDDEPVVVTGVGAVTGYGWGVEALWLGLMSGRTSIRPARHFEVQGHRTSVVSEVDDALAPEGATAEAAPRGLRAPRARRSSRAAGFALAAADEAWRQAGLPRIGDEGLEAYSVGVFFSGSTAGMAEGEGYLARLLHELPGPAYPSEVVGQLLNAPGDAVARRLGVAGPVETISSACASGTLALGAALDALRAHEVDVAVAGGSDALCQLTYSGFNALRAVDGEPCRPFRANRAGLSLGEGAGVLVLERADDARDRSVCALARVLGAGASCDAHHMTAPHPEGRGAAAAIASALADAGLEASAIDFVNAHGTGTPHNDISEWRALVDVLGERAGSVPVTSTKGGIGHLLGAAGAVEAVASVLCLRRGKVHPTPGSDSSDPEMEVDLVLGKERPIASDAVVLSTNFAFGGANAAVVLGGTGPTSGTGGQAR